MFDGVFQEVGHKACQDAIYVKDQAPPVLFVCYFCCPETEKKIEDDEEKKIEDDEEKKIEEEEDEPLELKEKDNTDEYENDKQEEENTEGKIEDDEEKKIENTGEYEQQEKKKEDEEETNIEDEEDERLELKEKENTDEYEHDKQEEENTERKRIEEDEDNDDGSSSETNTDNDEPDTDTMRRLDMSVCVDNDTNTTRSENETWVGEEGKLTLTLSSQVPVVLSLNDRPYRAVISWSRGGGDKGRPGNRVLIGKVYMVVIGIYQSINNEDHVFVVVVPTKNKKRPLSVHLLRDVSCDDKSTSPYFAVRKLDEFVTQLCDHPETIDTSRAPTFGVPKRLRTTRTPQNVSVPSRLTPRTPRSSRKRKSSVSEGPYYCDLTKASGGVCHKICDSIRGTV